ncbi:right-handed parallel beta-helix repeat-containing protein [Bacillus paramobilis]|uniref:right-handed parallel beta-helix repeat-containing protein n=1 Tax=Bacillus paramobilis TaxID=2817477 RepID=UPI003D1D2F71
MPISLNRWENTAQDRNFRNKTNENWDKLEKTHNNIEQTSDKALNDSAFAKGQSQEANRISNNVQEQLNTLVISGDSSVEAAQARTDIFGDTQSSLKSRIDNDFKKLEQHGLSLANFKTVAPESSDAGRLQRAIDAAKFKQINHVICDSNSLTILSKITLNGVRLTGRNTMIDFGSYNGTGFELVGKTADGSMITGFLFKGDYLGRGQCAINLNNVQGSLIFGNTFENLLGGGIIVRGISKNNNIYGNSFNNVSFAPNEANGADYGSITLGTGTSNNNVYGNTIENAKHAGIALITSSFNKIYSNNIQCDRSLNRSMGIYIIGKTVGNLISFNSIANPSAEGIVMSCDEIEASYDNKIIGNDIRNCKLYGISLFGKEKSFVRNTLISGNTIESNELIENKTQHAIFIRFADRTIVSNNTIRGTQNGVRESGPETSSNMIQGNRFENILSDGIFLTGTGSIVQGNSFDVVGLNGVNLVNAINASVKDNRFLDVSTGINVDNPSTVSTSIGHNIFVNCTTPIRDNSNKSIYNFPHKPWKLTVSGGNATAFGKTNLYIQESATVGLTNLNDGVDGQVVNLLFLSSVIVRSSGNIKLLSTKTFLPNETLTLVCMQGNWYGASQDIKPFTQLVSNNGTASAQGVKSVYIQDNSNLTYLNDGVEGQEVSIIALAEVIIRNSGNIKVPEAITLKSQQTIKLMFHAGNWYKF